MRGRITAGFLALLLTGGLALFGCGPVSASGYVHTAGQTLLDGAGQPLHLNGVAVGTDLLQEPWLEGGPENGTGMTTMLGRLASIIGQPAADAFRANYQTAMVGQADFEQIAADGFNVVRVPFNARYLTDQLPVLDQMIGWARDAGLYVVLDMHAATCSQNPYFTSDSVDGTARLWLDASCRTGTVAAWRTVASRYAADGTVAGYDLLNEPDGLSMSNAALVGLYGQIITAVRSVDPHHMVILEGRNYTKDVSPFTAPMDGNLLLSFHQYVSSQPNPTQNISQVEAGADRLGGVPVWVGEFGLDTAAHLAPQVARFDADPRIVGRAFWTWKMAARTDSQDGLNEYPAPDAWVPVINWAGAKMGAVKPTVTQTQAGITALLAAIGQTTLNTGVLAVLSG